MKDAPEFESNIEPISCLQDDYSRIKVVVKKDLTKIQYGGVSA